MFPRGKVGIKTGGKVSGPRGCYNQLRGPNKLFYLKSSFKFIGPIDLTF